MKKIFAALASALLVSTAFAQTAAPALSSGQQTQAAGQANLKADAAAQPDAAKTGTAAKQASTGTDKTEAKVQTKKTAAAHTKKTGDHKIGKKKHTAVAGADKATTRKEANKEASTAPVKADGAKTDTTQTN